MAIRHVEKLWKEYLNFIVAALACFAISMLTISYHASRVAAGDPVKSLRYE